jgi:hypothetical protein
MPTHIMRKSAYLILIVFFLISISNVSASENDTIIAFKNNIDSLLVSFRNPSNIHISKQLGGRKIKVKGTFENGIKSFKHKIKYNGGVKKESIVVYHRRYKKNKLLLMKVVFIDNQYFYIQKTSYKSVELALRTSTETYVAEGVFKKVEYNDNKNIYKRS